MTETMTAARMMRANLMSTMATIGKGEDTKGRRQEDAHNKDGKDDSDGAKEEDKDDGDCDGNDKAAKTTAAAATRWTETMMSSTAAVSGEL